MTTTPKNTPSHKMYRVIKGRTEHDKDIWTEIAALWQHKDGNGMSVKFKANEAYVPGAEYVIRRDRQRTASASSRSA